MRNTYAMSHRLYFPVHCRRANWYRSVQFLPRHCPSRHVLRCSTLPLCTVNGCSLCHPRRFYPLIPAVLRLYSPQHMNQNPLRSNVRGCQPDLLPSTLPRPRRYASSILRLPRRIHPLKYCLINRITNLPSCCNYVPIHSLRSLRSQTSSTSSRTDSL